jgi:chemotaxis protein MotB
VVLYAYSQVNEGKYKALSESLGEAFGRSGGGLLPATGRVIGNQPAPTALDPDATQRVRLRARTLQGLRDALREMAEAGNVRVEETPDGIVIDFADTALFDAGVATPNASARRSLAAAAQLVASTGYTVTIEGHRHGTDQYPDLRFQLGTVGSTRGSGGAAVRGRWRGRRTPDGGSLRTQPPGGRQRPRRKGAARNRRVLAVLKEAPEAPPTRPDSDHAEVR